MKTTTHAVLAMCVCLMFQAGCRTTGRGDRVPQVMAEEVVNGAKLQPFLHGASGFVGGFFIGSIVIGMRQVSGSHV